jgi:hypothetical protein
VSQPTDSARLFDLWTALGAEPRSAFTYVVTVPVVVSTGALVPVVQASSARVAPLPQVNAPPNGRPLRPVPPPNAVAPSGAASTGPTKRSKTSQAKAADPIPPTVAPFSHPGLEPDSSTEDITHIAGWVTGPDGAPLEGVELKIEGTAGPVVVTNAQGQFAFAGRTSRTINLRLRTPTGSTSRATFDPTSLESHTIRLG